MPGAVATSGVHGRRGVYDPCALNGPDHDAVTVPANDSNSVPAPTGDPRVVARVFALTDVGRVREHNEDTFLVADLESGAPVAFDHGAHDVPAAAHGLLFLVADGMGGAASGELASSMAGSLVLEGLGRQWTKASPLSPERFAAALRDATVAANTRIHQHARDYPEHRGMGTTATIAGLLGDQLFLVQVGDSRAYIVRDREARQITKDQSLMQRLIEAGELTPEEAEVSDRRNIILQALGPEAQVTVDITHQRVRRGDILILCSDGLSGVVKADEFAALAIDEPDMRVLCQKLVDRANARGGPDNITVVAVHFDGDGLAPSQSHDTVGYTAYPLAGTLLEPTREIPLAERPARRGDGGAPMREPISAEPAQSGSPAVPAASDTSTSDRTAPAARPAPLPAADVAHRRRAVQPIFVLLAAVAVAVVAWTVVRVLRG